MHDCFYMIRKRTEHNASIKWWQFWKARLSIPVACDECLSKRLDYMVDYYKEAKGL